MSKKKQGVFMVFREMLDLPDGTNRATLLNDPNTAPKVKGEILRGVNHAVEVLKSEARRNTQQGRWAKSKALRAAVMADYVPGKRGEPKRLQSKAVKLSGREDFPIKTVREWISDSRRPAKAPPGPIPRTWNAVIEGEMLIRQKRKAANTRPKKKSKKKSKS